LTDQAQEKHKGYIFTGGNTLNKLTSKQVTPGETNKHRKTTNDFNMAPRTGSNINVQPRLREDTV